MYKLALKNGQAIFGFSTIEWNGQSNIVYSQSEQDEYTEIIKNRNEPIIARNEQFKNNNNYVQIPVIIPTITPIEQPTADIIAKVQGKTFNSCQEAQQFIDTGIINKTDIEIMQETIDGLLIAVTGGAINV